MGAYVSKNGVSQARRTKLMKSTNQRWSKVVLMRTGLSSWAVWPHPPLFKLKNTMARREIRMSLGWSLKFTINQHSKYEPCVLWLLGKMAPLCVAGRLLLLQWLMFPLFITLGTNQIESLLVYDRQALLGLWHTVGELCAFFLSMGAENCAPATSGDPDSPVPGLCSTSSAEASRLVKLKVWLAQSSSLSRTGHTLIHPFAVPRCSWIPSMPALYLSPACLRDSGPPHVPSSAFPGQRELPAPEDAATGSTICRTEAPGSRQVQPGEHQITGLDFIYVTETWIVAGECSPLIELLPAGFSYFNSPRSSGRGGGTVTVYKNHFNCRRPTVSSSVSSFEANVFEVGRSNPVLFAVIYRPPK